MKLLTRLFRKHMIRLRICFLISAALAGVVDSVALAGPEGADVVNGQVSFQQNGNNTVITASNKAIINYNSFDIAQPEIVEFIQPNSSASVLNRILSANPTHIDGTLLANGRVFFVNPAGVYFGSGARINVNQLVASALNISNTDFINGHYNFTDGEGAVINRGDISAEQVQLIGKQVTNSGNISCPAGYVVMAAGDRIFLGEPGTDLVLEVQGQSLSGATESSEPGPGILNEGKVEAAGGIIALAASGDIYSQAISNVGTLSVSSDTGEAGRIELAAAEGTITNTGIIEASGSDGGQIAMEGARVGQFGTIHADGTTGRGGNIDLQASDVVALGSDSITTANAGLDGEGGDILVFSPSTAVAWEGAKVEAKGGTMSGDGGFIETSGNERLFVGDVTVDASAPMGTPGQWLLDPTNVTLSDAATANMGSDPAWVPVGDPATGNIQISAIESVLDNDGGTVTVTTASAHANAGTIFVDDPIDVDLGTDVGATTSSLTLNANDSITFDSDAHLTVTSSDNAGDQFTLNLNATTGVVIGADIEDEQATSTIVLTTTGTTFNNTGAITTNGGNVTLTHTGNVTIGETINAGAGNVDIAAGNINAAAGTPLIEIDADGDISLTGAQIGEINAIDIEGDTSSDSTLTVNSDGDGAVDLDINTDLFSTVDISIAGVTTDTFNIDLPGGDEILMATDTAALTITSIDTSGDDTHVAVTQSLGDVLIESVDTGAADFALTASNGTVTDSGAITANKLTVDTSGSASGGVITLDYGHSVGTINLTSDNGSNIQYVDADGVGIELANAGAGDVSITAGGDVTDSGAITANKLTVDTSGAASGGAITLNAATSDIDTINMTSGNNSNIQYVDPDGVIIDFVDAGEGDVTIQAASGSINDAAVDALVDIVADVLTLTATGEIGGTLALETTVASLDASSTTTGNIVITESDGLTLTDVDTVNGAITINTGGATVVTDVAASGSGDENDVTIIASAGDVTVEAVSAAGSGDVTIQATAGSINETGSGDAAVDISGDALTLTARDEIGGAGELDIETTVASLEASSTTSDIVLTESDNVTLGNIQATLGNVILQSMGGAMTHQVSKVITAGGGSLTMRQRDSIDTKDFTFSNQSNTDLTLESFNGSVISDNAQAANAADEWQSITATAEINIELQGSDDIKIGGDLTSNSGGVSIISDNGTVRTAGDSILDNIAITGYSDTGGAGVDLPYGPGKAAIVISSAQNLTLGTSTTLNAGGVYDSKNPLYDDRAGIGFAFSGPDAGDPIDVAIYVGSAVAPKVEVHSTVTNIGSNGAMVIDASDTVRFGDPFKSSAFNVTHWLEVVSRVSTTLQEVINGGGVFPPPRLPEADNPENVRSWFDGTYVIRGKALFAEILALTNPVPLVPPQPLEPEIRDEVEGPDIEALVALLTELGIGVQPYVTNAYADSLSTDLRLYKAAEKLQQLIPILEDADGTGMRGLRVSVAKFFPTLDTLTEENIALFSRELENRRGDGSDYDNAGKCISALTQYVYLLGTEIGWPVEKSTQFVMGRYVPRLTEGDDTRIAVVQMYLQGAF